MPLRMQLEPMLAAPLDGAVPVSWAVEPKWDGYRNGGGIDIRSRRGTDMSKAFPEVASTAWRDLPADTLIDGEIGIWHEGRLAFELLGRRLNRRPAAFLRLASETPVHYVAFGVLYLCGSNWMRSPYRERRAVLQALFREQRLIPPWTLCPSTAADDLDAICTWLSWAPADVEGLVAKNPGQRYLPGRRALGQPESPLQRRGDPRGCDRLTGPSLSA